MLYALRIELAKGLLWGLGLGQTGQQIQCPLHLVLQVVCGRTHLGNCDLRR
jgi:hypothetical protein